MKASNIYFMITLNQVLLNLHNNYNIDACPSIQWCVMASWPTSKFYHIQSSRSPVRPLLGEAKPSCVYSILKPHGQSFRRPVRPLLSEAKPSYVYSILKPHGQSSRANQTAAERGKAELHILNFKTISS